MHNIDYFENAKPTFLTKLSLLKWEAAQWVQYVGFYIDEYDNLFLQFKSSTYGISFEVKQKAFSSIYGEPYIEFSDAYQYFKKVKYGEYIKN